MWLVMHCLALPQLPFRMASGSSHEIELMSEPNKPARDEEKHLLDLPDPQQPPMESRGVQTPAKQSSAAEVADFLHLLKTVPAATSTCRGRLVFAMDATMSRQPTWDLALALQAEMFDAVKSVGGLDVQLVYFRGHGECRASKWVADPDALSCLMTSVDCRGGYTQVRKVLSHTCQETVSKRVAALVYVGDCMEESADELCGRAGELALHGVPAFIFQEGTNAAAEQAFREIARITQGAYCHFDQGSSSQLRDLLSAVAVFAAGGRKALERSPSKPGHRLLLEQLKR